MNWRFCDPQEAAQNRSNHEAVTANKSGRITKIRMLPFGLMSSQAELALPASGLSRKGRRQRSRAFHRRTDRKNIQANGVLILPTAEIGNSAGFFFT
jgi:hypothetical protein